MTIYRSFLVLLSVFAVVLLLTLSCTRPVLIGSDFLDEEKASIKFQDTFQLSFFSEKTDSVIVHSNNTSQQLVTYLIGNIQDPIFGKYAASIYAQPLLSTIGSQMIGSTLDSVVLQLRYDTLGNYGTISEPVTFEVYQMLENPPFAEDYYSDQIFMTSSEVLGSATFMPAPEDTVILTRPDDTLQLPPHVRIALDKQKFEALIMPGADSTTLENQDTFLHYFNGLYIKMTSGENTMLGFNLLNSLSGVTFYYDKGTSEDQEFKLIFTAASVKVVHMEHDYAGSAVEPALGPEPEEDDWYIQGLSGVTTHMRLEGLDQLGDAIINQAILDIYCYFPVGDVPALYPPCPIIATQEDADTALVYSQDVFEALILTQGGVTSESYNTIYGGHLGEPEPGPPVIYKYTMNVTLQFKEIYKGNKENIIYFNPFDKGDVPNRAVIFGPNHPTYAPRLSVYYTAL